MFLQDNRTISTVIARTGTDRRLAALRFQEIYETAVRAIPAMSDCLRVFAAGLECIYEPACTAIHAESVFRKDPPPELKRKTQELAQVEGSAEFSSQLKLLAQAVVNYIAMLIRAGLEFKGHPSMGTPV